MKTTTLELGKFDLLPQSNINYDALQKLKAFQDAAVNEAIVELQKQLDWMWNNCNIVYFPPANDIGTYPIEHNPHANKESRGAIEFFAMKELSRGTSNDKSN